MKFLLVFFLFWLSSCGTEPANTPPNQNTTTKKDTQEPATVTKPNTNLPSPTLAKPFCEVKEILTSNCKACHASRQPRLDHDSIKETLSKDELVREIYKAIDSGSMPRGKDRLDQKSIDLIKTWMNAGGDTSGTCP